VLTVGLLVLLSFRLDGVQPLKLHMVRLPIQSYRLLAMAMDEDGDNWFGSIHHVIHRYTPSTGAVETIPLPQTSANYKLWASQCLAANRNYQIANVLSARGEFYATGSNILAPQGRIVRENRGDIIVWQTQSLKRRKTR